MRRLDRIPLYVQVATLTILNIILAVLLITYSSTLLTYMSIPTLTVIALIGYVSGKSSRASVIILELMALILIISGLSDYVLASELSLTQTMIAFLIIYVASLILSSSFLKNVKMDVQDILSTVKLDRNILLKCLTLFIGITAIALIIVGIIELSYGVIEYLAIFSVMIKIPRLSIYGLTLVIVSYISVFLYSLILSGTTLDIRKEFLILLSGTALLLLSPLSLPLLTLAFNFSVSPRYIPTLRDKEALRRRSCDISLGEILDLISNGGFKTLLSIKGDYLCMNLRYGDSNHTLIIGATGTGKTSLAKAIVEQAVRRGYKVIVIDAHGEYVGLPKLVEINPRLNPIDVVMAAKDIGIDDVVNIVTDTYRLGDVQKEALKRLLEILLSTRDKPNIDDLLDLLNKLILLNKEEFIRTYRTYINREVLKSLIPYVRSLKDLIGDSLIGLPVGELLNKSITINVSKFAGSSLMRIYIEILLRILFNEVIKSKKREITLLIVEEFHNYVSKYREGILGRILREGRKFGINVIAITQGLPEVSDTLLNNFKWIIIFPMVKSALKNVLIKLGINLKSRYRDLKRLILNIRNFEPLVWNRDERSVYHIKAYIRG